MRRLVRTAPLLIFTLQLGGCPRPPKPVTAGAPGAPPTTVVEGVLRGEDAAATHYGERRPVAVTGIESEILALIQRTAEGVQRPPPQQDAATRRAARLIIRALPAVGPPHSRVVEFALRSSGLTDPPPHMVIAESSKSAGAAELEQLRSKLASVLGSRAFTRVGLALRSDPSTPGRRRILVALFDGAVNLDPPFPRRLARGQRQLLRFEVDQVRQVTLVTTDPGGRSASSAPARHGERYSARLGCSRPGVYQVEITGEGRFGVEVLANFPIYCNRAPPASVAYRSAPVAGAAAVDVLERDVVRRTNAIRRGRGLRPLRSQASLTVVARAHSEDMRGAGFVGHVSPTTGSPSDRLQKAGVVHLVVRENVARAYSTEEALEQLMNSPAHRVNILSTDVTAIGAGVAVETSGQTPVLLVTQLFLAPGRPYDPATARGDVLKIIRSARGKVGLSPLKVDAALDRLADRYVETMIADAGEPTRADAALTPALARLGTFQQVAGVKVIVSVIDALQGAEEIKRARYTHLGIGVGRLKEQILIFLLFGTAR